MNPQGKNALITGGAHRVGKAITMMLANAGANVIVNYNSSADAAVETVAEAKALGVDAFAVQCDVSDYQAVQQMTAQIEERFGGTPFDELSRFPDHPAWYREAWYLGQACMALTALTAPSNVILGGRVMGVPGLLDKVRDEFRRFLGVDLGQSFEIKKNRRVRVVTLE